MLQSEAQVRAMPTLLQKKKCVLLKHTKTLCAELHGTSHSASSSMLKIEDDQKTASEPRHCLQCNVSCAYI